MRLGLADVASLVLRALDECMILVVTRSAAPEALAWLERRRGRALLRRLRCLPEGCGV